MMPQGFFSKRWSLLGAGLTTAIASGMITTNLFTTKTPVQAQNAGALTVRSDIQEANTETGVVTARGNVYIDYPARNIQATAAQAQYFSEERTLVLSGNVYVLQDGNSLRGERMTYKLDEGRFVATPAAREQVEAIYLVPEEEEETATESSPREPNPTPTILLPSSRTSE